MRDLARESDGRLGVVISLQQPNRRLLEVADQILVLARGSSVFFGTVEESIDYFTQIGFAPPADETPTDFYLQVTDLNYSNAKQKNFGFVQAFANSDLSIRMHQAIAQTGFAPEPDAKTLATEARARNHERASGLAQFIILLKRNFLVAYKDPTLYYLQLMLHSFYGA